MTNFSHLYLLLLLILITSCSNTDQKDREKQLHECDNKSVLEDPSVHFVGFAKDSLLQTKVYRLHGGRKVLFCFVTQFDGSFEGQRQSYDAHLRRSFPVADTFLFDIPGERSYLLTGMELGLVERFGQTRAMYICELVSYTLDGRQFRGGEPLEIVSRHAPEQSVSNK